MNTPQTPSQPPDSATRKKGDIASETARHPLSRGTVESLQELGEVLRQIHTRLLSEGYIIKDGEILKPG